MKHFRERELAGALAWSRGGGQAVWVGKVGTRLFDLDFGRLGGTAKGLGVPVNQFRVLLADTEGQHIDLCGLPLARALGACRQEELSL